MGYSSVAVSWWPDLNTTGPCFLFIEDKNWTDLWSKIYCWGCTETKLWENVLMSKYLRIYLWTRELKHWILFRATKTFHDKAVGLWNCGPSKKKHWRLKCYWTEHAAGGFNWKWKHLHPLPHTQLDHMALQGKGKKNTAGAHLSCTHSYIRTYTQTHRCSHTIKVLKNFGSISISILLRLKLWGALKRPPGLYCDEPIHSETTHSTKLCEN